uniref:Sorting nexin 20 n=1 Tax=Nothoprocta perdicaria TaxID=30464 RepID=A0A8C7EAV6_NOTPE
FCNYGCPPSPACFVPVLLTRGHVPPGDSTRTVPSSHSSMTTKELQEYWKKEKCQCRQVSLVFEIPSTRIVEHHLSKYVMYKIIILQTGSFDCNKSIIERRYSDFEKLHRKLLEDFTNICLACLTNHRLHAHQIEENLNKIWVDNLQESMESRTTIY